MYCTYKFFVMYVLCPLDITPVVFSRFPAFWYEKGLRFILLNGILSF